MSSFQEYDLEIKSAKIVRGQGLCNIDIEARDHEGEEEGWENEVDVMENKFVIYQLQPIHSIMNWNII